MNKTIHNGKYPPEAFHLKDGKLLCVECKEWLPIGMFCKRRNTKRGYNMCCKRCYGRNSQDINGELWADVLGFEGFYKVSPTGKILSCERIINNNGNNVYLPAKIHNQRLNSKGYLTVVLSKNGHSGNFLSHRIVAEAFIPNPNKYDSVNHKNEIKTDNRVDNLEWCDRAYNNNYGTRNERISKKHLGSKRSDSHIRNMIKAQRTKPCPVIQKDDKGSVIKWFLTVADAIEQTGIQHIHSAIYRNGKSGGFYWERISYDCLRALAAINDEMLMNQWYVVYDGNEEEMTFVENEHDLEFIFRNINFRKATAEEIVEYFKK